MLYYIIDKLSWDNNAQQMISEEIGYTTDIDNYNAIQNNYNATLGAFIETNKTELENGTKNISEFFQTTPIVYGCFTTTNAIEHFPFTEEITDITPYI
jgi:hypothetical protein